MMEMAIVSFDRVRLQYYVSQGNRRAIWLQSLLHQPSLLFGITLFGANIMLQVGSECSRQLYYFLNLPLGISFFSQALFVLIFAELSPIFAARRHPESVALLGIPLLYFFSRLVMPIAFLMRKVFTVFSPQNREKGRRSLFTREELEKLFEIEESRFVVKGNSPSIAMHILYLQRQSLSSIMRPLSSLLFLSGSSLIKEARLALRRTGKEEAFFLDAQWEWIIGVLSLKQMVGLSDEINVSSELTPLWRVHQESSLVELLYQMHLYHRSYSLVFDEKESVIGVIFFEDLLRQLFSLKGKERSYEEEKTSGSVCYMDRSFSGDTSLAFLNELYQLHFNEDWGSDLESFVRHFLGTRLSEGEHFYYSGLKFCIRESGFNRPKRVQISSLYPNSAQREVSG